LQNNLASGIMTNLSFLAECRTHNLQKTSIGCYLCSVAVRLSATCFNDL